MFGPIFAEDQEPLVIAPEAARGPATQQRGAGRPSTGTARALILGCSGRKRPEPAALPAIDRYDGPSFRVLRRYLRSHAPDEAVAVFVLSAEHGLISGTRPLLPYDRAMTPARAQELAPRVARHLADALAPALSAGVALDLLVCCTRAYLAALAPALASLAARAIPGLTVRTAPFRPGERLACLHDWLHGGPPSPARLPSAGRTHELVAVRLRGVDAVWSADGLLARGRQALQSAGGVAGAPVTWAVDLDEHAVSPKWLVGLGFGLPHAAFSTGDALRVLAQLGIPVRRAKV